LERRGVLRRVHGGAIPVERLGIEPGIADREVHAITEKERIARAALDELPDGGSIIIDAGTTTVRLAELLPMDRELTVVTHSIPVAAALVSRPNVTLHLLGGIVRGRTLAAVGEWTRAQVAEVFADVAFMGTNGISVERGLTTPDVAEASVKKALIDAARRTVVLADHSKFGREDFARVAPLSAVDTVITDAGIDVELAEDMENAGPRVVVV
jgi:DeoR family fructose operon transcriptional repressor